MGRRPFQVGRLVHDHRWVARTGRHRPLVGLQRLADDARAAGHQQHPYVRVMHQLLRRLDGGHRNAGDEIRRPACGGDRLVQELDVVGRNPLGIRVDVEHDGVPRRDHRDRVVDDRRRRVGGGGDGADQPHRGPLDEHHPLVPGLGLRLEVFRSRRLGRDQSVLLDLVLVPPQARFGVRPEGEILCVGEHRAPDRLDHPVPRCQPQLRVLALGAPGGGHRIRDGAMDPVAERLEPLLALDSRRLGRPRARRHLSQPPIDRLDDPGYLV